MNKLFFSLLLTLFPMLASAADSMTFAPPTTDYSVGYLADLFGIVDGVLHGTGSQILGSIFAVFNAAVMALGGMIITYTMLVSTMNTAHEGEMLGKKWNSIWVPVRATAGFALLIPKASGYCLLQIFVMWVVVQGVGAADKLWSAALGYLNRGGVIIQAPQPNPVTSLTSPSPAITLLTGAINILSGQVCMLTIQKTLEQKLSALKNKGSGVNSPCNELGATSNFKTFCKRGSVPNFNDTIDAVAAQDSVSDGLPPLSCAAITQNKLTGPAPSSTSMTVTVPMPNFPSTDLLFHKFNGICGSIQWEMMSPENNSILQCAGLTQGESDTASKARAIAVQQMVSDLLVVAQVMVNNDPAFSADFMPYTPPQSDSLSAPANPMNQLSAIAVKESSSTTPYTDWATNAFGEPLDGSGNPCINNSPNCTNWGVSGGGSTLLNGTELVGAVLDYNGVMQPTLTLLKQGVGNAADAQSKAFIAKAETMGWIMAGSYFFDLVILNNKNLASQNSSGGIDSNSGLANSTFSLSSVQSAFSTSGTVCPTAGSQGTAPFSIFCELVQGNSAVLGPIFSLFTGQTFPATSSSSGNAPPSANPSVPQIITDLGKPPILAMSGPASSSVFNYLQNANVIQIPGLPAQKPLAFAKMMHIHFNDTNMQMPNANFSCMGVWIITELCIGRWIGEIFYNVIINTVISFVTSLLASMMYSFLMSAVSVPLSSFAAIFKVGVQMIQVPGINPIVALASMGTYYINFVGKMWLQMIMQTVNLVLSMIGILMLPLLVMTAPVIVGWAVIMLGIGMTTAYYVPLVPYMIFTFGAIAWFMAVIEAMVAAPVVALGIIHPEGHDAFGKGEAAIMILMNVFLRPAMMIIGYIAAISLSYVGVWLLNASFDHAVNFMQPGSDIEDGGLMNGVNQAAPSIGTVSAGYTEWAGIFAYFFSILLYTMMYMTIVEKAFTLIAVLPDKVLRWIGGQPESHGQDAAQWMADTKGKVEKGGEKSGDAMGQVGKAQQGGQSPPESGSVDSQDGGGDPPGGGAPPGAGAGGAIEGAEAAAPLAAAG